MKKERKTEVIANLQDRFARAQGTVVVDYRGLTVPEMAELRGKLRETGAELVVAKNTLTILATKESEYQDLEPYLQGPTALAFGYEDAVAPTKVLAAFMKDHPELDIRGGKVEGALIDRDSVLELAKLPSREELLTRLVCTLNAPITGLVNVLSGVLRGFVTVLSQIADEKEKAGAES